MEMKTGTDGAFSVYSFPGVPSCAVTGDGNSSLAIHLNRVAGLETSDEETTACCPAKLWMENGIPGHTCFCFRRNCADWDVHWNKGIQYCSRLGGLVSSCPP